MFSKKKNLNFFLATNFFPTNSNGVSKKKKKKKIPYKKIVKDVLKIFLEVDSIMWSNLFDDLSLSFLTL